MDRKTAFKRSIVWGAAGLFAIWLALAFRPQAVPVDLAAASRGPLELALHEEGYTRVREVYTISAPVAGRLLRADRHSGDPVTAGETVIVRLLAGDPSLLDSRSRSQAQAAVNSARAALALAQAEVSKAQAQADYASTELARLRRLATERNVSEADVDRAEFAQRSARAALDTARAAVRVREAELDNARAVLATPGSGEVGNVIELKAPVSGSILRVLQESETVVQAGTPLVEIGDPQDLEIVVEMLSTDAVKIPPAAVVTIDNWGADTELAGRVRRVEPYGFTKISALGIEEQRVRVLIDLVDEPARWQALGHGFRVEVRVRIWSSAEVLRVASSALFRDGDAWAVFIADRGRARHRLVDIGRNNGHQAQVLGGLQAGEQVILHPSERITDKARVTAR